MTTGNKIVTKTIDNVTFVPLESVQTGADSIPFVYLKNGNKQVVVLGESNENNVIIEQGVQPGTILYLNTPAEPEKFTKLLGQDLISVIKEKEKAKKEAERKVNEQGSQGFGNRGDMMGMPGPGGEMGGRPRDTAAMRQMRQRFQNMSPAERDSLRKRFGRQGGQRQFNPNGGQRQSNQQPQQPTN